MALRHTLSLFGLLSVLFALSGPMPATAEYTPMKRTITVSATGTATAVPDQARIQTGIVAEAGTARDALAKNSEAMVRLIEGLKKSGIDPRDIQTASFHLEPRYTNPREGQPPAIDGYRAVNEVGVTVRSLDRLGEILDNLVSLGANQMNGLAFEVSNAETLRDAARKDAVANARRRAELYAAAAGAKVGEVVTITEAGADMPRPMLRGVRATPMAAAVPVERGTETLDASVTVTWELD